jgi:hypothetical protein
MCCLTLSAQNQLRLLSAKGSVFRVYINDKVYNKTPQAEVLIESIKKDTLQFKIEFESGSKYAATVFLLNKGQSTAQTEFNYNIDVEKNKLILRFMGAYSVTTLPNPIIPKMTASVQSKTQTITKQTSVETTKTVTCNDSIHNRKMEEIILLLKKEQDDGNRQIVLKNNLSNNCFSVYQVWQLTVVFMHEREKLKAIINLYPNTLNKNNFSTLLSCLNEDVYKSQLSDFIKKHESNSK